MMETGALMTDEPVSEHRKRRHERILKSALAHAARPKVSVNNSFAHVGVAMYFLTEPGADDTRAARLAELLIDSRWPWLPWWASYTARDKREDRSAVRVGGKNGVAPLLEGIASPRLWTLYMNRAKGDGNFTSVALDLRHVGSPAALQLLITCRSTELPKDKTFPAFLALVHDVTLVIGARHAIIGAWPTYDHAVGDTWLTRMVLDTPKGDIRLGLPALYDAERDLVSKWRSSIGDRYARHPRWGTYLHPGHLAAIGGVERIRAEVAPAVIEPVGDLTYVQLTDSIDTAMTTEAETKRRALQALMAPILVGAP